MEKIPWNESLRLIVCDDDYGTNIRYISKMLSQTNSHQLFTAVLSEYNNGNNYSYNRFAEKQKMKANQASHYYNVLDL